MTLNFELAVVPPFFFEPWRSCKKRHQNCIFYRLLHFGLLVVYVVFLFWVSFWEVMIARSHRWCQLLGGLSVLTGPGSKVMLAPSSVCFFFFLERLGLHGCWRTLAEKRGFVLKNRVLVKRHSLPHFPLARPPFSSQGLADIYIVIRIFIFISLL